MRETSSRWTRTPSRLGAPGMLVRTWTSCPRRVSSTARSRIWCSTPPTIGKYQSETSAILCPTFTPGPRQQVACRTRPAARYDSCAIAVVGNRPSAVRDLPPHHRQLVQREAHVDTAATAAAEREVLVLARLVVEEARGPKARRVRPPARI